MKKSIKASKSTDQANGQGYRLHYNSRLRASLESQARRRPKSRQGVMAMTMVLLGVFGIIVGGVYAVCRFGQSVGEAVAESDQATTPNVSVVTNDLTKPKTLAIATEPLVSNDYSKTIGFVGDSLTFGCCADAKPAPDAQVELMGDGYRAINRGINGSTTRDWVEKFLDPAIEAFQTDNVEVVQVMLGVNDITQGISVDEIMGNLQQIANRLRRAEVKIVIINQVPYSDIGRNQQIRQLNERISYLPEGDGIYIGDQTAYGYFQHRPELLSDKLHMTEQGYAEMAKLWLAGYERVMTLVGLRDK